MKFSSMTFLFRTSTSRALLGHNWRLMSSTTAPKLHKFILFVPYAKDSPRSSVLPRHRAEIAPLVESGVVKIAGPFLTPESRVESEDAPQTPFGSCIIYEAENIDVVRKIVESDVYYTSGVWDRERLMLVPFLPVTPFP